MGYSANTDCQVRHIIDTNTATPIARAPYRVGEKQLQELHKQLADLLERELIRPSVSAWVAPILFVGKNLDIALWATQMFGLRAITRSIIFSNNYTTRHIFSRYSSTAMPEEATQPIMPIAAAVDNTAVETTATQAETVSVSSGAVTTEVEGEEKKRKNHAQTSKERREHAKKRVMIRKQERVDENPRERPENSEPRLPKRKVALLIGFCGTGYQGMQVNPNAVTIESELFKALCAAGAVSAENAVDQSKVQLQRAARTDKGVHAAGQVVSLKMIIEDSKIIEKINQHLPAQIRAWDYVKVVRSFNSKTMCDSRIYEYMLPTYVFMPPSPEYAQIAQNVAFDERCVPDTTDEDMKAKREFRAPAELLEYVRNAFQAYVGSHDFRNFTVTKGCTANNSRRYIHSFTVSDPMIIQGGEWLSLKVKGQSFMLHQIRKMVGLIIMMARSDIPLRLIDVMFSSARVNVPKAPGLGLLLECPVFDGYNRRANTQKSEADSPITFEPYVKEITEFKQKFIYDNIVDTEMKERTFDFWAKSTQVFPEQYLYINKECEIPESTLVVTGVSMPRRRRIVDDKPAESSEDEVDTNDS
ncbi:tRNA pseudouridine synthase 1 [Coemansia sp. RSA 353]|nr:tRNA pseudouridine synthase 1 [Coemansia sp. RSA 562]KAJ2299530.1 tRNA pseudouridine synthase 1 [Coemansia sp. RSA 353]